MFGYTLNLREDPHLIVLADELKGLHAEPELSVVGSWVDLNCGVNFAPGRNKTSDSLFFVFFLDHPSTTCHYFSCTFKRSQQMNDSTD